MVYVAETLKDYREAFQKHHGVAAPPPLTGDLMFCHEDAAKAEAMAIEYMSNYFLTIVRHYEIMSEHFKDIRGYDYYATAGDLFRAVGLEVAAQTYCKVQTWGTPEMILEKLRWRREFMGDYELVMTAYYGGMAIEEAERRLRLFAREVLPELRRWQAPGYAERSPLYLDFSPEQIELQRSVREVLARECPIAIAREAAERGSASSNASLR